MIVRMSKITVMGPKDLLLDTLARIQQLGVFQLENGASAKAGPPAEGVHDHPPDAALLSERQALMELRQSLTQLLACLPEAPPRPSLLDPATALPTLCSVLPKHLARCGELRQRMEKLREERRRMTRYTTFLASGLSRLPAETAPETIDCIGFDTGPNLDLTTLGGLIEEKTGGHALIETLELDGNTLAGLIVTEKELVEVVRNLLLSRQAQLYDPPPAMPELPLAGRLAWLEQRQAENAQALAEAAEGLAALAGRLRGIYHHLARWVDGRLAVIQASALVHETRMCFFIDGWMPSLEVASFQRVLTDAFGGTVHVEENAIVEQDIDRVPTMLKNPPLFEPFELFSRLLPPPSYASFDLTPFLAIFFPIFFGMMLGDLGYGALLLLIALVLIRRCPDRRNVCDAGKILAVCAGYTLFFGWLYGECFGTFGRSCLGISPVLFDRHTTLAPFIGFAVAVGAAHILLGLLLGAVASRRKGHGREGLFKLFSIVFILVAGAVALSFLHPRLAPWQQPLLATLGILAPALLLCGGILAPLEMLQHFGHIISYARIMAIGLTSVLLAHVANHLAGLAGSIWIGLTVAVLLHGFNLVLGIFAPTIHGLRLHYVEFLSKFMEPGGRPFKPLGKP